MTTLQKRMQKLERTEILTRHLPLMEQLQRAMNDAAVRLTGRDFSYALRDEDILKQVVAEVRDSFMKKLSAADLDSLIAELEPIAFGNDTAALEALRQKVIREVDEELGVMASNTTGLPLRGVPHSLCHPLGPVPKLE
jgi:hypothetical protein